MNTVAIIGASQKEDRYSNMAQKMLLENGYAVVPVSRSETILGQKCYQELGEFPGEVDTVTMYIGSARVMDVIDSIIEKKPRRVIFNPGTENLEASELLQKEGIEVLEACTLVLLRTGQF